VDFEWSKEQEEFRQEVRSFLEKEIAEGTFTPIDDAWLVGYSRELSRKLGAKGWIGFTWPKQYGGQGRSYLDRLILTEELLAYGAPAAFHWLADRQVGPALIASGSEQQKAEFLPRIIRGEISICLGMSEPGVGSDLASLQTRAIQDGDDYIISGQKLWTTGAHMADYCYLVARTDPNAPKHKGISEFVVDMKLPGINIRPVVDVTGASEFNEVFFDEVRVPSTCLIGKRDRGWYQIAAQLDYERSGIERLTTNYRLFRDILEYAKQPQGDGRRPASDPLVRYKLADLETEFETGRLLIYRVAWLLSQGKIPNYEAAMAKAYCTAFEQNLAHVALQVLGLSGQLAAGSRRAPLMGRAVRAYIYAPAYSIQGGTSEILKNIVATRGLGLPSA